MKPKLRIRTTFDLKEERWKAVEHSEFYIFGISTNTNSFDLSIDINSALIVSVTIEPIRSLLTVRYHELFDWCDGLRWYIAKFWTTHQTVNFQMWRCTLIKNKTKSKCLFSAYSYCYRKWLTLRKRHTSNQVIPKFFKP